MNPLEPAYLQSIPEAFAEALIRKDLPLLWFGSPDSSSADSSLCGWTSFSKALFMPKPALKEQRCAVVAAGCRAGLKVVKLPGAIQEVGPRN